MFPIIPCFNFRGTWAQLLHNQFVSPYSKEPFRLLMVPEIQSLHLSLLVISPLASSSPHLDNSGRLKQPLASNISFLQASSTIRSLNMKYQDRHMFRHSNTLLRRYSAASFVTNWVQHSNLKQTQHDLKIEETRGCSKSSIHRASRSIFTAQDQSFFCSTTTVVWNENFDAFPQAMHNTKS